MLIKANNRWQAFGIHIAISVVLFLIMASVIYFYWYPGFLFRYDGGLEGMKLIAGVDFFIGPVLTLCVYKIGKKSLPFDLVFIAVLQLACLSGGMWTVWQTRPVAVVFAQDRFIALSYQVYIDNGIIPDRFPILQEPWPVWVVVLGTAMEQQETGKIEHQTHRVLAHLNIDRYVRYSEGLGQLESGGIAAGKIRENSALAAEAIAKNNSNVRFFEASTGSGDGYLAVDLSNRRVINFILDKPRKTAPLNFYLNKSKNFVVQFIDSLMK